jgi:hypothetical protein
MLSSTGYGNSISYVPKYLYVLNASLNGTATCKEGPELPPFQLCHVFPSLQSSNRSISIHTRYLHRTALIVGSLSRWAKSRYEHLSSCRAAAAYASVRLLTWRRGITCPSSASVDSSQFPMTHRTRKDRSPPVALRAATNAIGAQACQARVAICRITAFRTYSAGGRSCAGAAHTRVWFLARRGSTTGPSGTSENLGQWS